MSRSSSAPVHGRRAALTLSGGSLAAALFALSGCTTVLGAGPVLDAYDLQPPSDLPRARSRGPLELVIEAPAIPGALDGDRILVRPDPLQAQYLPGARWTETTPELLRTLLVQSFEATGGLRQAGRRPLLRSADYRLVIEILAFELDANDRAVVEADVRLAARLVDEGAGNGGGHAARLFTARVPAADRGTLSMVRALNEAAGVVSADLVRWAMARMGVVLMPASPRPAI